MKVLQHCYLRALKLIDRAPNITKKCLYLALRLVKKLTLG